MFKNYLKIALRNFIRNKTYSIINILGLTIGFSASLLIGLYVIYEHSYDNFHKQAKNIYCLESAHYSNGNLISKRYRAPIPMGPKLKQDFPEIKEFCRLEPQGNWAFSYEGREFKSENAYQADASILTMFSFPLIEGNPETALMNPETMVISESLARRVFGNINPVGKVLKNEWWKNSYYTITGVFRDVPENSHLKFDMLTSINNYVAQPYFQNNWNDFGVTLYLLLDSHTNPKQLENKLDDFYKKQQQGDEKKEFSLKSLGDIHLKSDSLLDEKAKHGDIDSVNLLLTIALIILIIAWINFVNLTTIRSFDRSIEIGVKKVLGVTRSQLIIQFLFESLLYNGIAALAAFTIVEICIPIFNEMFGLSLSILQLKETLNWLMTAGIVLGGIVFSGMITAFILSSIKPITVLKRIVKGSYLGARLRNGLVVFQFIACIALIVSTLTVFKQTRFMQNFDLGMNIDKMVLITKPGSSPDGKLVQNGEMFIDELLKHTSIKNVTLSEYPGKDYCASVRLSKDNNSEAQFLYRAFVDHNFFETYQVKLLAGRNFSKELATDKDAILINETARKMFGFESPEKTVNQSLYYGGGKAQIIGVVQDYNQLYLKQAVNPVCFCMDFTTIDNTPIEYFSVKLSSDDFQSSLAYMKNKFSEIFPNAEFNYIVLEDFFNLQYANEQKLESMLWLLAVLTIFVAGLGLWGLSAYGARQRIKEIGVRKVMGASSSSIVWLLSKNSAKWVIVAIFVSWPIAYFAMNKWLQNFAYRIDLTIWPFLLSGLLALSIALLTVSWQAILAAMANPVEALRYE